MKSLYYTSIFLLVLSLDKCKEECEGDATSYNDCKDLEVPNGAKCCFSNFDYTPCSDCPIKACKKIAGDEDSVKEKRAKDIRDGGGEVITNYLDCGTTNDSWNLKFDLLSLILLLFFNSIN